MSNELGATSATHSAGAFDIRNIIGGLMGLYGVVLIVVGLFFTSDEQKAKIGGDNLNLQVGIGLLIFGVLMIGWAVLRPLRVPGEVPADGDRPPGH